MEIVEKIKAAGVVGCGGAGFPTHKKLAGSIEYLIVNGAECEPLLRTDRYLMLFQAPRLVKAVAALGRELGIPQTELTKSGGDSKLLVGYTKEVQA